MKWYTEEWIKSKGRIEDHYMNKLDPMTTRPIWFKDVTKTPDDVLASLVDIVERDKDNTTNSAKSTITCIRFFISDTHPHQSSSCSAIPRASEYRRRR